MASSYSLSSNSYQGRYLKLTCTQTKDTATNKSTINWTLTSTGGTSSYYSTGATTVKINGTTVYSKSRVSWDAKVFPAATGSVSGTLTVSHNTNGDKSISVSLSTAIYTTSITTKSGTWTLDSIPRQATITSAPNFTDEDTPKITYSNPAGSTVSTLQACIASTDGKTIYCDYRDISKTGTSYTFTFTSAEKTTLQKINTSSNTVDVKFYVKTVIGDNTFYSTSQKTLSIKNPSPKLSPTVKDTNSVTTALTGDNSKLIKYYSTASTTTGATAVKYATIKSQKTINNGKIIGTASGTFTNVENNKFSFIVADSRGNMNARTLTPTMIDYIKLTCDLQKSNLDANGNITLTVKGNYFNGSFGATNNSLEIQYRYKVKGGTYSDWKTINATLSGNTYTATNNLTGLDYQKTYVFQARAIDKLATKTTGEISVKSIPIFDWGENDFKVNGDFRVTGATTLDGNLTGKLFISQSITPKDWNMPANSSRGGEIEGTFKGYEGYTPILTSCYCTNSYYIGIINSWLSGSYSSSSNGYTWHIDARNFASSDITADFTINILWIKTSLFG